MQYEIEVNGRVRQVQVQRAAAGRFTVELDGVAHTVDTTRPEPHTLSLLIDGASHEVRVAPDPAGPLAVTVGVVPLQATINSRRRWGRSEEPGRSGSGPQRLTAPMPGKIVRVSVKAGDQVTLRQPLAVIEAMKMENELRATREGRVTEVHVQEGQSVEAGTLLLVVAPD